MRRRGFTLIEMLVVIAIIALLSSITIAAMSGVQRGKCRTASKTLIDRLKNSIQQYNEAFGDYPPSNPKFIGLKTNGINDGIKCLVRCLRSTRKPGNFTPFEFAEKTELMNLLDDKLGVKDVTGMFPLRMANPKPDNFEAADGFYQPLVYLHNADYVKGQQVQFVDGPLNVRKVVGVQSAKTGQYEGLTSYQLWSVDDKESDLDGKRGLACSW